VCVTVCVCVRVAHVVVFFAHWHLRGGRLPRKGQSGTQEAGAMQLKMFVFLVHVPGSRIDEESRQLHHTVVNLAVLRVKIHLRQPASHSGSPRTVM
jgi:hypothetical protein